MRPPNRSLEAQALAALAAGDYLTAEQLCDQWDAEAARPARLLPSALWYAGQGLAVFPLQPGSKQPMRGSRGCKDATTDPDRIRAWWHASPEANVAIATGGRVDVIDIDGPLGVLSWSRFENLPPSVGVVSTPRPGGSHLYIAPIAGLGNRAGLAPGIDVRAEGGYVVAPPSVNAEGVLYRWRTPLLLPMLAGAVAA